MSHMPLFIDMSDKDVLVVGGGRIASRKIKKLLTYGCNIKVITREVLDTSLFDLDITIVKRDIVKDDLLGYFLVVLASDNIELNKELKNYILTLDGNALVNSATDKGVDSVRFPSTIDRETFQIAISGKGNPKIAKSIKKKVEGIPI